MAKVPELELVGVAVFGGVDREREVDLRDWDAIRAWSGAVAELFVARGGWLEEASGDE